MVVAPVPTTAIVTATSGALCKNKNMTIRRLLNERTINAFNRSFKKTTISETKIKDIRIPSSIRFFPSF